MFKIIDNKDEYVAQATKAELEKTDGFCLFAQSICMCDDFKRHFVDGKCGVCPYGRYEIIEIKENN